MVDRQHSNRLRGRQCEIIEPETEFIVAKKNDRPKIALRFV